MKDGPVFEYPINIRYHDCDSTLRLSPVAVHEYFQEVGLRHCDASGMTMDWLAKKQLAWVFVRLHLRIKRYPTYQERLRAQTWPINLSGLYNLREYRILDERGGVVAVGTSRWVLLDTSKKRAIRVPGYVEDMMECGNERTIEDDFKRLPPIGEASRESTLDVQFNDIDTNQHVNSAAYFSWCLHALPHDFLSAHRLRSAEIAYRQEAVLGDTVRIASTMASAPDAAPVYLHEVLRDQDGRLLVQLRTHWEQGAGSAF